VYFGSIKARVLWGFFCPETPRTVLAPVERPAKNPEPAEITILPIKYITFLTEHTVFDLAPRLKITKKADSEKFTYFQAFSCRNWV